MRHEGGHEQKVAGADGLPDSVVQELAMASGYDVNLVARVRLLRVRTFRRIDLNGERTVSKYLGESNVWVRAKLQ